MTNIQSRYCGSDVSDLLAFHIFQVIFDLFDGFLFSVSTSDPVIADPELYGGFELTETCRFLVMMSDGLYQSLEAVGKDSVNVEIAAMVAAEFGMQSTLNGVAQAVVDKVVRMHHDTFMMSIDARKERCQKRDDITLLVRNFNFPSQNVTPSPSALPGGYPAHVHQNSVNATNQPLSVIIPESNSAFVNNEPSPSPDQHHPIFTLAGGSTLTANNLSYYNYTESTNQSSRYTNSYDSSQSGGDADVSAPFAAKSQVKKELPLDKNGRIAPYVDFSCFYTAVEKLTEDQRQSLSVEAEPRPAYEPIPEDRELGQTPVTETAVTPVTTQS